MSANAPPPGPERDRRGRNGWWLNSEPVPSAARAGGPLTPRPPRRFAEASMSRHARKRRRRRHKGHPVKRAALMGTIIGVAGVALGALALVGWVVAVAESAPNISQLKPQNPGGSSEVFAADGTSLGFIQSSILRTYVH